MYYVYVGMNEALNATIIVGSKEFAMQMVDTLINAEKQKVNFATTIGKPLAKVLKETFK